MGADVSPKPRVGGPARGYSWAPFEEGNGAALRHGAYASPVKLEGRAADIADAIRPTLPLYCEADEPVLRLMGLTLVRIERAAGALEDVEDETKASALRTDLRAWISAARNLANDLGMTPTSRARLGLDLARTEDALEQLLAKGAQVRAQAERRGLEVLPE
jgi:hypothetical protein